LYYGDVVINKGDGVLLTVAKTDDQTIGTVTGVTEGDVSKRRRSSSSVVVVVAGGGGVV